jgi:translation initiation factor 5
MSEKANYINISSSSSDDPFFRYKMNKIIIKHEGVGNGVKTVLKNLSHIAKDLNRDSMDILQYIASDLSVCSLQRNDDYIINGTFSLDVLQDIISRFVDHFVLCDVCENPETSFSVKKQQLCKTCNACGATLTVKDHKLNKRIISRLQKTKQKI